MRGRSTGRADHPRSRGVYRRLAPVRGTPLGSSPLARGLRRAVHESRAQRRIIPARAGFTPPRESTLPTFTDHPRSRGVYSRGTSKRLSRRGSSPLARGLPPATSTTNSTCRIIPARAGFTLRTWNFLVRGGDHPRSRGVYSTWQMNLSRSGGSSPLARGLRVVVLLDEPYWGIIPARAGFTFLRVVISVSLLDHPRSRGVYCRAAHYP